jgi:hypothetical protein
MASSTNSSRCLFLILAAVCVSVAWGKSGFLQTNGLGHTAFQRRMNNMDAVREELDGVLKEALGLGHGLSDSEQEAKKAQILPMFDTMPKDMSGRVTRDAMHYMVQRYFGAEHGWFIKGFDASSTVNASDKNSLSSVKVLKDKLPGYVESVVEERLEHEGFGLNDVVAMVVVLERMILDEGMQMLEDAYYLQEKETNAPLTKDELMDVVFTYMLPYDSKAERRNRTER